MPTKITRRGPALSESRLAEAEREMGVQLPGEYRAFLLKYNGGVPRPREFDLKHRHGPYTGSFVRHFFSVDGPYDSLQDEYENRPEELGQVVPIAEDEFGNLVCLSLEPDDGKVYFWNHEGGAVDLVADSIGAFLSSLKPQGQRVPEWVELIEDGDVEGFRRWYSRTGGANARDSDGLTPLAHAVGEQQLEIVRLLVESGESSRDAWGTALEEGRFEVLKLLVALGIGRRHLDEALPYVIRDGDLLRRMLEAGANARTVNLKHRWITPLHAAAEQPDPEAVRLLLKFGARPGVWNADGQTPLHLAICAGHLETARALIDAGEDLNAQPPVLEPSRPGLLRRAFSLLWTPRWTPPQPNRQSAAELLRSLRPGQFQVQLEAYAHLRSR